MVSGDQLNRTGSRWSTVHSHKDTALSSGTDNAGNLREWVHLVLEHVPKLLQQIFVSFLDGLLSFRSGIWILIWSNMWLMFQPWTISSLFVVCSKPCPDSMIKAFRIGLNFKGNGSGMCLLFQYYLFSGMCLPFQYYQYYG